MRENTKKITFQLIPEDRIDLMQKLMVIVQAKLRHHKRNRTRLKHIAEACGLPKTRISEIYRLKYMGEPTLIALIKHGFMSPYDLLAADMSVYQLKAVEDIIESIVGPPSPPADCLENTVCPQSTPPQS